MKKTINKRSNVLWIIESLLNILIIIGFCSAFFYDATDFPKWLSFAIGVCIVARLAVSVIKQTMLLVVDLSKIMKDMVLATSIAVCVIALVIRIITNNKIIYLFYTAVMSLTAITYITKFTICLASKQKVESDSITIKIIFKIIICILGTIYGVLFLSEFLRFIGNDDIIINNVVTVLAALIGGGLTLAGVSWTIRKADKDKNEEERKKNIPYIRLCQKEEALVAEKIPMITCSDVSAADSSNKLVENIFCVNVKPFYIKNISDGLIILRGVCWNNRLVEFKNKIVLEKNASCFLFQDGAGTILKEKLVSFELVIIDSLENKYKVGCFFEKYEQGLNDRIMSAQQKDKTIYQTDNFFNITSISLPKLIKE